MRGAQQAVVSTLMERYYTVPATLGLCNGTFGAQTPLHFLEVLVK
jgi:hypothetical protein